MQHEIMKSELLLDEKGNLREPGYAKSLLSVYNRKQIKAGALRIKEWDYYLILNEHYGLALTIADNSYMGMDSITFLDFDQKWEKTMSPMKLLTKGKKKLPATSQSGNCKSTGNHYQISFRHENGKRILGFQMDNFLGKKAICGQMVLVKEPKESMVIATPFNKDGYFYYNQKINGMRAEGIVKIGNDEYLFTKQDSYGLLDWGRGVWTYSNTWYWGSASGQIEGITFGFNIGYGFGDTHSATENMLFYNGKVHKLKEVQFHIPNIDNVKKKGNHIEEDYMKPWKFTSDDGRFEMDFIPLLDRSAKTSFIAIESNQHQVFGHYTGKAILDEGKEILIKNFFGFAEKVKNKW